MRISDWSSDVCSSDLVDNHVSRRRVRGQSQQRIYRVRRQNDWQHAILDTVIVENVRNTRRYDAADAKVGEGPRGTPPAGPAAEIVERNQAPSRIHWRYLQD